MTPLVVHIIYSLKSGGLENGLVNIINRTPPGRYRHAIICLTEADEFARRITAPGVEVIQLHKKEGHDFGLYRRLWQTLKILKPAIVHTRNLATLEMQFIASLGTGAKRVHGEHGRDMDDLDGSNRKFILLRKFMRFFVHRYIAVSRDLSHWLDVTIHLPQKKIIQIYNGVDTERFHPADDLMAQHQGKLGAAQLAVIDMKVGAADPAGEHFEEDLFRPRLRNRKARGAKRCARPLQHHCYHCLGHEGPQPCGGQPGQASTGVDPEPRNITFSARR